MMSKKEATIIQNFNAEKRKYEYSIKGYDVTKSIEILLKKHKEEYDKERRVFESTKGYLEAQQEYEKHIANLQSQLDQANERLKGAIVPKFKIGQEVYSVFINRKYMERNEVCNLEITHIMRSKSGIFYQDNNKNAYWFNEKNTFLTEQEAQAKLQELRG